MPNIRTDVDIDVDEFMEELSSSEIEDVIDWLKENKELEDFSLETPLQNLSFDETIFIESLNKLKSNLICLNKEELEMISNIASKF